MNNLNLDNLRSLLEKSSQDQRRTKESSSESSGVIDSAEATPNQLVLNSLLDVEGRQWSGRYDMLCKRQKTSEQESYRAENQISAGHPYNFRNGLSFENA